MKRICMLLMVASLFFAGCNRHSQTELKNIFQDPPQSAKPWVFWYWMHGAVTSEGVSADLEAMRQAGIGGAYLMPIKDVVVPPHISNPARQLTPEWWALVRHAMNEAKRLGLQIAMHASDGFALAGGPWITPELSMQKIVWTEKLVNGGAEIDVSLDQPETIENYYKDIAVFAYPTHEDADKNSFVIKPRVTSSLPGTDPHYLAERENNRSFGSDRPCWIQYAFDEPFTVRSITIRTPSNNHQSRRLEIAVSDDGRSFRSLGRMEPPRYGWQDWDADLTYAIEPVTAQYFRFNFNPAGSEPGAEDLDAAKWKANLRIMGIELSGAPKIHQYEGKTGKVWRIANWTTDTQIPDELCPSMDEIVDLTKAMDSLGHLMWNAPAGKWTILRIGHTSTGHTNYTGGGGLGLECDKFNPEAVKLQFENWYGEAIKQAGPELAREVLKGFHVDSWECGSQNWSPVFRDEFISRRGYDPMPYLPVMTGLPLQSARESERFLHDMRETIAELVLDNFYKVLHELASENGASFSAECVSPTMTSDGMLHYQAVDIPMGEFWLRSPTHDKLNDMLDAISGAHIYGKNLVQAEGFTQIRIDWDEHPGMLKTLGDRNYALGFNRFSYHVFTHNPWMDRKPGMTLDRIGLYFQRDQTWWKPGRAWVEYAQRCQALLQQGRPQADIAVFTGEEIPRRAVMPDRLVSTLPGIFGGEIVERERQRLANVGQPLREFPAGVTSSANISCPEEWIDPLRGYAYDSFNKDALLRLAKANNGKIELPGGASYSLLVVPGPRRMSPENFMSVETARKLRDLIKEGATIVVNEQPVYTPGLADQNDSLLTSLTEEIWGGEFEEMIQETGSFQVKSLGKGRVIRGPVDAETFEGIGLQRDFIAEIEGKPSRMAWTHRKGNDFDLYFISNQGAYPKVVDLSLRVEGKKPELYDPVTGEVRDAAQWTIENGRTNLRLKFEAHESVFVVLQKNTDANMRNTGTNWYELETAMEVDNLWKVAFDSEFGGPADTAAFERLTDWSEHKDSSIRNYSGLAVYNSSFNWQGKKERVWLDLGHVADIAEVIVNGQSCGVAWTHPYRVEITEAVKNSENKLTIEVANTWANRLIGDHALPAEERTTWTTAPYRLKGRPLAPAGLLGPVALKVEK